jgi:hypothetical protein
MKEKQKQNEARLGYIRGYKKKKDTGPKEEAKPDYKKSGHPARVCSTRCTFFVLLFSTIITVILVVYALYTFIHVSKMGNLSDVHLSETITHAVDEITGKVDYSTPGYEGWMIYQDGKIDFRYPPDWQMKKEENIVVIRKFNQKLYNYFESISISVVYGEISNVERLDLQEVLKKNKRGTGETAKEVEIGGKKALRTGRISKPEGILTDSVYWDLNGRILYMDFNYYSQDKTSLKDNGEAAEKILDSVKILTN